MPAFPPLTTLLAFAAASLGTLLIPGPSVGYVVARSIEHGRTAGLYSVLGLETGAALHVGAAVAGLTALISSSAFHCVKWAGAGYLAWLAVREFRSTGVAPGDGGARCSTPRPLHLYRDGVLVDLLNPKTGLFFLAFLPQFVDPSQALRSSPRARRLVSTAAGGVYLALAGIAVAA